MTPVEAPGRTAARKPLVLIPQYFGGLAFDHRTSKYLPFDAEATALLRRLSSTSFDAVLDETADTAERDALTRFFDQFYALGTVLLVVGVVCFTLAAMLFRGQSSVTTYVYTIAIIFATAFFVGDLFRLIPLLGPTLAEILAIYSVYLAGIATSALQRLALGPTIAVVVIALILWAAFFFGVESSGVLLQLTFQIGSLKLNV